MPQDGQSQVPAKVTAASAAPAPSATNGAVHQVAFLLVENFSFIAFASAIEPLRNANRASGNALYAWRCYSADGRPIRASNGVEVTVNGAFDDLQAAGLVLVVAGLGVERLDDRLLLARLRRLASHGATVGGLCTAPHLLARAGLLNGYRCTIHWENLAGFAEAFPEIDVTPELYEIDRNRLTCAGGTAALDMMLTIIATQCGHDLAAHVADTMMHHRIREGHEGQRMELRARLGVSHPKLLAVIQHMEETLETPLSCAELAATVGLSTRQLERLFRKYLKRPPTRYYLALRLDRARFLLAQTSMPILGVALACGFVSASHFSKCYREHFGRTPSEERRV
ncbi:MAG: GlxA family transcriptional regulator [Rhodobacterales bacterium]|nr:GlxA family transcriptional regulator [Rhodobacterales bacterium]